MTEHPIRLVVTGDLTRSRLTTFFRLILAIPHFLWLYLWSIVAYLVVLVSWFATLFSGRNPDGLHEFVERFLRYATHVYAYVFLAAEPYPPFVGKRGSYPVDLEVDPPQPQNRLVTFFRLFLALPALALTYPLSYGAALAGLFAWFVVLAIGRIPLQLRNFIAYWLRYQQQTAGYLFLLTSRYANLDPLQEASARSAAPPAPVEEPPAGPGP